MVELDLVIRGRRVLTPGGEVSAEVGVVDGRIVAVESWTPGAPGLGAGSGAGLAGRVELELAADEVLMPGAVDTHVHVNDPGRTEWEGFESATRAAAAGGVTTIIDMPLNSIPPTVDVDALEVKQTVARGAAWVDVGFWGGAVPGNVADLRPLWDAGVYGFKCFLLPSGVDEFPPLRVPQLEAAMREIASWDGLLIVHAEDAESIERAGGAHGRRYGDFLASRPLEAENRAVATVVGLARRTGCRVHVLHVSSAGVLPLLAAAKREGLPVTAETCPHYLALVSEEVPDGATQFKCCPPIRDSANRDLLWDALREKVIDIVVSDHSPSTPALKSLETGDFGTAWGGISSLQLGLSVVWTEARGRGLGLADVSRWMSRGPADLVGLSGKGRVEVGAGADLCVFAPDEEFVVQPERLLHRHALTPYAGRSLTGVVRRSWLHGAPVDVAGAPTGRLLRRGPSRA